MMNRVFLTLIVVLLTFASFSVVSAAESIGGNPGWIAVHCNVDGAQVYFDTTYEGVISRGVLTVPVTSTGTPFTILTVRKPEYTTYTGLIPVMPGFGETIDMYTVLDVQTTMSVPTNQPTLMTVMTTREVTGITTSPMDRVPYIVVINGSAPGQTPSITTSPPTAVTTGQTPSLTTPSTPPQTTIETPIPTPTPNYDEKIAALERQLAVQNQKIEEQGKILNRITSFLRTVFGWK
jgi:hypothetical protein